jgi:hypothetical protein
MYSTAWSGLLLWTTSLLSETWKRKRKRWKLKISRACGTWWWGWSELIPGLHQTMAWRPSLWFLPWIWCHKFGYKTADTYYYTSMTNLSWEWPGK